MEYTYEINEARSDGTKNELGAHSFELLLQKDNIIIIDEVLYQVATVLVPTSHQGINPLAVVKFFGTMGDFDRHAKEI